MVYLVPEDVQVVLAGVERRDLDRAHERESGVGGCASCLIDAVDGVVVGQREQLDAG